MRSVSQGYPQRMRWLTGCRLAGHRFTPDSISCALSAPGLTFARAVAAMPVWRTVKAALAQPARMGGPSQWPEDSPSLWLCLPSAARHDGLNNLTGTVLNLAHRCAVLLASLLPYPSRTRLFDRRTSPLHSVHSSSCPVLPCHRIETCCRAQPRPPLLRPECVDRVPRSYDTTDTVSTIVTSPTNGKRDQTSTQRTLL
jgi:hypothetical protein